MCRYTNIILILRAKQTEAAIKNEQHVNKEKQLVYYFYKQVNINHKIKHKQGL